LASSSHEIQLRWSAVVDPIVTGYEVVRDGNVVTRTDQTTASEPDLAPRERYCYTVFAVDCAGGRSEPATACTVTPGAISAPASVTARMVGEALDVSWLPRPDAVSYDVTVAGRIVAHVTNPPVVVDHLREVALQCAAVRAIDASGAASDFSTIACARTDDIVPPTAPTIVQAAARSGTSIALRWSGATDNVGVAGYEVVREDGQVVASTRVDSAVVDGLTANQTYCYVVRSIDGNGNRSPIGPRACTQTVPGGSPAAPADLRVHDVTATSIALHWSRARSSENSPAVYVIYDSAGSIGATSHDGWVSWGLKPATRHCFRVGVVSETGGISPLSLETCATTPDTETAEHRRRKKAPSDPTEAAAVGTPVGDRQRLRPAGRAPTRRPCAALRSRGRGRCARYLLCRP
jgi:chitodextrinase